MGNINEAMTTLTAQLYNAMTTGIGLDRNKFQLYQGPNSMMSTSQQMWNMFNAVPPTAVNTQYFDPNQSNLVSADYNLILTALVANADTSFQSCMGDYYTKWQKYFEDNDPKTWDAQGVAELFNKWALKYAPSKSGCVTNLTKAFINPVNVAIQQFENAHGSYAWNGTIDLLQQALSHGASKSCIMDSLNESSDVQNTWAKASLGINYNLFSFSANANYDSLSAKATSAGINVEINYDKLTTYSIGPYAQADPNNPVLAEYSPWYNGSVMSLAYTTKDNTVWNSQSPTTWETAFGENGFLQNMNSAIVVADGISITVTSSARYSSTEQQSINASAKTGYWPFFSASGQGGTTNNAFFNDEGQFTITTAIPRGNPQILGALVTPVSEVFGGK